MYIDFDPKQITDEVMANVASQVGTNTLNNGGNSGINPAAETGEGEDGGGGPTNYLGPEGGEVISTLDYPETGYSTAAVGEEGGDTPL